MLGTSYRRCCGCSTRPVELASARAAGATSQRVQRALPGSIWLRLPRSGCPWCPGWLDLVALCAPGRPSWLELAANDCPIDTISKKNRFAYRRSCFDAACFVRSGTFLHASNLMAFPSRLKTQSFFEVFGEVCGAGFGEVFSNSN